jgi:hypothetical protein
MSGLFELPTRVPLPGIACRSVFQISDHCAGAAAVLLRCFVAFGLLAFGLLAFGLCLSSICTVSARLPRSSQPGGAACNTAFFCADQPIATLDPTILRLDDRCIYMVFTTYSLCRLAKDLIFCFIRRVVLRDVSANNPLYRSNSHSLDSVSDPALVLRNPRFRAYPC